MASYYSASNLKNKQVCRNTDLEKILLISNDICVHYCYSLLKYLSLSTKIRLKQKETSHMKDTDK